MIGVNRFVALLLILLLFNSGLEAQPNSSYFMKGVPQTKDMNPAKHGLESGFYISLPFVSKLDVSANTNNWNYNDLVHKGTGLRKDSMVWDFEHLVNSFGKENFVQESASLTLVDFGWRRDQKTYSVSVSEHELAEPFFKKELAEFLYYGNDPLVGTKFSSGHFGVLAQHYRQFAFSFSKENSKKLTTGITGKLLFGMAGIDTRGINFETDIPSSGDLINFKGNGNIYLSGPVEVTQNPENAYDLQFKSTFNAFDYLLNFRNPGLAVDLGVTYKVSKRLELSASMIDVGFVRWHSDLSTFTDKGNYPYVGLQLNMPDEDPPTADSFQPLIDNLKDSLLKAFPLELSSQSFSTILPAKFYLGGEYMFSKNVSFTALARIRLFNNQLHGSYTASVNTSLGNNFCLSAGYSYYESTWNNLGVGLSCKVSALQLYAATDNIFSPFYPTRSSNLNLRFGINFIFLKKDRIEKRRTQYMPDVKKKYRGK